MGRMNGALAGAALLMLGACATDYDGGPRGVRDPAYEGGSYGPRGLGGTGVDSLDPWLRNTPEGQAPILYRFDHNYNGEIGEVRAHEANRWFRRFADRDHDLRLTDHEVRRGLDEVARQMRMQAR